MRKHGGQEAANSTLCLRMRRETEDLDHGVEVEVQSLWVIAEARNRCFGLVEVQYQSRDKRGLCEKRHLNGHGRLAPGLTVCVNNNKLT